jgi:hypothetical protein
VTITQTNILYGGIVVYFVVGLICGVVGAWDATHLRRKPTSKPAVDIAVGIVAVVIAIFWPFWLIGWVLFNSYFVRWYEFKDEFRKSHRGWMKIFHYALGVGFIAVVFLILWVNQYGGWW